MSRVVVTGSAGFIGRHTTAALTAAGHDLHGYDLATPIDAAHDRQGDIRSRADLAETLVGADVVVHLAAKVGLGVDLSDIDDYVGNNDLGTAVVLRALAEAGCRRLVVASSMVVYGEGRYHCEIHGSTAPGPRAVSDLRDGLFDPRCPTCGRVLTGELVGEDTPFDPRNAYAASKVATEHLTRVWAREVDASAVALRFHNVYGPGMPADTPYAGVASLFAAALARGDAPRVFEDGGQRRDFVHVTDVAAAIATSVDAALEPPGGALPTGEVTAFNVGSGTPHTVGELATTLATELKGPTPVVTGDYRLGDVRHITASSRKIADQLGWRAVISFATGIAAFAAERRATGSELS
ncbi:MAG TPA: NAD-dependent epimerase/dehydratase family protein [Actinopolymorphaceae bacterium]|jgi:dTDP-L-rhamnose 4-epimerase